MIRLLSGKNAIITGCSSGIGFQILSVFCDNGANVWALVHKSDAAFKEKIQQLQEQNSVWIRPIEFDLLDSDSIKDAVKRIIEDKVPIDILVNNAGVPCQKTLSMTSTDELRMVMNANFIAPSLLMQLVSRIMLRYKKGNIINITSRSGLEDRSGVYGYGSSKAALIWGTRAAAREYGGFNIRVNGIAPGLTETKMGSLGRSEKEIEHYISTNAIKRYAYPLEIANTALFLASDSVPYITGQIISVDGGRN